ncbi:MAG: SUF system Fe-S cluster assembly protein [Lentimicrobiaceae bacterium]|jgi:FeS assembly SUF system protein|nr:SUF system Fe-S cluster assembly protein [Lentimicrobiaceae bacterium]
MKEVEKKQLEETIIAVLKTIFDPDIPVSLYELGLIYKITIDDNNNVKILMTLTSPNCPVADALPAEVQRRIAAINGVESVEVELTFDPPWTPDRMSETAQLELDMFY